MWTNGVFGIVTDQPTYLALVLEDTEVVEPERDQLFAQLGARIQGAQQFATLRFLGKPIALLTQCLAGLLHFTRVGKRFDALPLGLDRDQLLQRIGARNFHRVDLLGNIGWQRHVGVGQLGIQESTAALPPGICQSLRGDAVGQTVQQ